MTHKTFTELSPGHHRFCLQHFYQHCFSAVSPTHTHTCFGEKRHCENIFPNKTFFFLNLNLIDLNGLKERGVTFSSLFCSGPRSFFFTSWNYNGELCTNNFFLNICCFILIFTLKMYYVLKCLIIDRKLNILSINRCYRCNPWSINQWDSLWTDKCPSGHP